MSFDDEGSDYRGAAKAAEVEWRAQDRADYHDAIAGRSNGRMGKAFVNGEDMDGSPYGKKSKSASGLTALEWLLMNDPVYAKRHHEFGNFLRRAEAATEAALIHAKAALDLAEDRLRNILDNANRLADGTRVFRAADGRVMNEHGNEVSKEDAASIVWNESAAKYEDYTAAKDAVNAAQDQASDLQAHQIDLGDARNRWDGNGSPLTIEEMDAIEEVSSTKLPDLAKTDSATFEALDAQLPSRELKSEIPNL